jgi:hypothetical protein
VKDKLGVEYIPTRITPGSPFIEKLMRLTNGNRAPNPVYHRGDQFTFTAKIQIDGIVQTTKKMTHSKYELMFYFKPHDSSNTSTNPSPPWPQFHPHPDPCCHSA